MLLSYVGITFDTQSQDSDVNLFTGRPIVSVPIWTVTSKDLAHPVGLVYSGGGVKVNAISGKAGIGWHLNAGGLITRELRGLPDEYKVTGNNPRYGWLENSNHSTVGNSTFTGDADFSTCSDESTDWTTLNSMGLYGTTMNDTEPDIFHVNTAGLSFSFLFDNSGNIKTIPYADVAISYNETSDMITTFDVTDNRGVIYSFGLPANAGYKATKLAGVDTSLFSREIEMFQDSINYNALWHLTKITSPAGGQINFAYHSSDRYEAEFNASGFYLTSIPADSEDTTRYYTYKSGDEYEVHDFHRRHYTNTRPRDLSMIYSDFVSVQIVDALEYLPVQIIPKDEADYYKDVMIKTPRPLLNKIVVNGRKEIAINKEFIFSYGKARNMEDTLDRKTHVFLSSVTEHTNGHVLPPYTFDYYNVNFTDSVSVLPKPGSRRRDYFGYFNNNETYTANADLFKLYVYPDKKDADRYRLWPISGYDGPFYIFEGKNGDVNEAVLMNGSLSRVNLPSGGHVSYYYEPNTFYDSNAGFSRYGGGIRVTRVTRHDGVDFNKDIIKNYSYNDGTGQSSGKLLYRPQYAFTHTMSWDSVNQSRQYYSEMAANLEAASLIWKKITVRSEEDLSAQDGPNVGYQEVSVFQTGQGKVVYEFGIPNDYGDASVTTSTRIARQGSGADPLDCTGFSHMASANAYPYGPNTNIGSKRGLLEKSSVYHENGFLLEETTNTYSYLPLEDTITGLRVERLPYDRRVYNSGTSQWSSGDDYAFVFSQYNVLTNAVPIVTSSNNVKYNANSPGLSMSTSQTQEFDTSNNQLSLRKTTSVNSDGKKFITEFTYSRDYVNSKAITASDSMSAAIKKFHEKRMLTVPVETVSKIELPGATARVMGASLNLFMYGNGDKQNLYESKVLTTGSGITDFTAASLDTTQSTATFGYDQRYETVSKNIEFDANNYVNTVEDRAGNHAGTLMDHSGVFSLVAIAGAKASEVWFCNFEDVNTGALDYELKIDGTIATSSARFGDGHHSSRAYKMPSGNNTLYKLHRDDVTMANEDYVVSFWANEYDAVSTVSSITVTVKLTAGSTVSKDFTFSKPSTWQYYEGVLSASGLSGPVDIEITTNADVRLDDILLYPVNASVQHNSYNANGQMEATITGSKLVSYEYDAYGRVQYTQDFEGNIISVNKYSTKDWEGDYYMVMEGKYNNLPIPFKLFPENIGSATYYWDAVAYDNTTNYDNHDFSGITGSSSNSYTMAVDSIAEKMVLVKVVVGAKETIVKQIFRKGDLPAFNEQVPFCVSGPIRVDQCGNYPSQNASCNYVVAGSGTVFSVDASGLSGAVDEYIWRTSHAPPAPGDLYPGTQVANAPEPSQSSTYTVTNYSVPWYVWCDVKLTDGSIHPTELRTIQVYSSGCNQQ